MFLLQNILVMNEWLGMEMDIWVGSSTRKNLRTFSYLFWSSVTQECIS